jgi:uncharacterized protein involved in outer membrane biogenesis
LARLLTAIAGLLVLVLGSALIAPFFIDWTRHKAIIEAEASRLIGLPVVIDGTVDLRLLPSAVFKAEGVRIGGEGRGLTIEAIEADLSLGALTRGEVRLIDVRLNGPRLELGLDAQGRMIGGFDAGRLAQIAIERVEINDGSVAINDPRANRVHTIAGIGLQGAAPSFAGPWRIEGAALLEGARTGLQIQTARATADGIRLRISLEPSDLPHVFDIDAEAKSSEGRPSLAGQFRWRERAASESPEAAAGWRAEANGEVRFDRLTLRDIRMSTGSVERSLAFTGALEVAFGPPARIDGALVARSIDLDRILASSQSPEKDIPSLLARLIGSVPLLATPAADGRITLDIGALTLGGDVMRDAKLDALARGGAWQLRALEARLPGQGQISVSGALGMRGGPVRFEGPVSLQVRAPATFAAWFSGETLSGQRTARPAAGPISLEGRMRMASDGFDLRDMLLTLAGSEVRGSLGLNPQSDGTSRLEARLTGADINAEPIMALVSGWPLAGSLPPFDVTLVSERLRYRAIDARGVSAHIRQAAGGIALGPLSVRSLNGVALQADGQLGMTTGDIAGTIQGDSVDDAVAALVDAFGQNAWLQMLSNRRGTLGPVRLEGRLTGERTGPLRLQMRGSVGSVEMDTEVRFEALGGALTHIQSRMSSAETRSVFGILGLSTGEASTPGGRAAISIDIAPAQGSRHQLSLQGRVQDGNIAAEGLIGLQSGEIPAPGLLVRLDVPDAVGLLSSAGVASGALEPFPLMLSARVTRSGAAYTLDISDMESGAETGSGQITLTPGSPNIVGGELALGRVDARRLLSPVLGLLPEGSPTGFSSAPYLSRAPIAVQGRVALTARSIEMFDPRVVVRDSRATLVFANGGAQLEQFTGQYAGGRVQANLAVERVSEGLRSSGRLTLSRADLGQIVWQGTASGRMDLDVTFDGRARSPAALAGAISGQGRVVLEDLSINGLSSETIPAIDRHLALNAPIDAPRIAPIVEAGLAGRRTEAGRLDQAFEIELGTIRLNRLQTEGADPVSGRVTFELPRWALDAEVSMPLRQAGIDPARLPRTILAFRGPLETPERRVDVRQIVDALNLRRFEQDVNRLERLQTEIDERERRMREIERQEEERRARERAERERVQRETAERERVQRENAERERAEQERLRRESVLPQPQPATADPDAFRRRIEGVINQIPDAPPDAGPRGAPPLPPPVIVRPAPQPAR